MTKEISRTPTIDVDQSLGALVTSHPGIARELERLGLDYCCHGHRSLGDACRDVGLDPSKVTFTLAAVEDKPVEPWATMRPAELVDHLEAVHHAYLQAELPRLVALADKVTQVHGERHPELADTRRALIELRDELEPHLAKEEHVLFPMIRELMATDQALSFHCGTLANPISVMLAEHDRAGELLARLRSLTGAYATPPDGCRSYHAYSQGLADLEADTHLHIHKENNLLFPAVIEREQVLRPRTT